MRNNSVPVCLAANYILHSRMNCEKAGRSKHSSIFKSIILTKETFMDI